MSDLAAFVAATIESKVVADLKKENDTLREEIDRTRASALQSAKKGGCIEVTGQAGSPVYAHGLLHKSICNGTVEEGVLVYNLDLITNTQVMCLISKAMEAEIRVNGIKLFTIGDYDEKDCIASVGDAYECDAYRSDTGCGTHWKGLSVAMSFGPFPPLGGELGPGDPRDPRDMRDEEVQEVSFDFVSIYIEEEGNEDDVLLVH